METFSINPAKLEETGNYIIGRQKHNGVQLGTFYTTIGMNYFGKHAFRDLYYRNGAFWIIHIQNTHSHRLKLTFSYFHDENNSQLLAF